MSSSSSVDLSKTPTPSNETAPTTPLGYAVLSELCKNVGRTNKFSRWRPSYHLLAKDGWMNDPCAPGYDPATGLYHISFQWNPNGPDWGDISWGSATSPDLISWTLNDTPSLSPDMPYDNKGVFTGCFINGRDGSLTYAYTSVSDLPIHHTLPHVIGSESLSLAKSFDHGKTWEKIAANPILPSEPTDIEVTGWRDPFVAPWPRMSQLLGLDSDNTLFGIISGGLRNVTPTTFIYAIDANDLTKWDYIGPLTRFGLNYRPSRWSGDLGKNWEVSNFMTLKDEEDPSVERDFIVMGTEGCLSEAPAPSEAAVGPSRPARGQLWMSGSLQKSSDDQIPGPVDMTYDYGGHLDHGCMYAANSFFDPRSGKQIVWGWLTEEHLCDELRHAQGWSGILSMPRELRLQTMRHVIASSTSVLSSITSIELEADAHGSHTVRTLAIQPYQSLIEKLRQGSGVRKSSLKRTRLANGDQSVQFSSAQVQSTSWELDCMFQVSRGSSTVGVSIAHTEDFSRSTTLTFDQSSETFIIDRPAFPVQNSSELINSASENAPHTLFTSQDPASQEKSTEPLHVRVWRDSSALEVYVNGRTAISTRIYAGDETFGMRFFGGLDEEVDGDGEVTELLSATIWDGIGVN
ncbi:glycoside hydrolase family 32 protein [Zymoseptoria brevis]|uniref:Glycoside hydrolase family 32 protein n=1 Tax=Zymoseptoria brevis TaxID=1047168 RepID=A0A0F4GRN3_9PEZI|nr:glycoside hydrolase family 32 protein [Zymoseptoria brevis]